MCRKAQFMKTNGFQIMPTGNSCHLYGSYEYEGNEDKYEIKKDSGAFSCRCF